MQQGNGTAQAQQVVSGLCVQCVWASGRLATSAHCTALQPLSGKHGDDDYNDDNNNNNIMTPPARNRMHRNAADRTAPSSLLPTI